MGKTFFNYDNGDFGFAISDNTVIDSAGKMMKMSDNISMDMDSGKFHVISSWSMDADE